MKIQDNIDKASKAAEEKAKASSKDQHEKRLSQNDKFMALIYNPAMDTLPNYEPWEPRAMGQKADEMDKLRSAILTKKTFTGKEVSRSAYDFDVTTALALRALIAPDAIDNVREEFKVKLEQLEKDETSTFQDVTKHPLYADCVALAQWLEQDAPGVEKHRKQLVEQRKVEAAAKARQAEETAKKQFLAEKKKQEFAQAQELAKQKADKALSARIAEARSRRTHNHNQKETN